MRNIVIATEAFSSGRKRFFMDFKLAQNNTNYMAITSRIAMQDGSERVSRMMIWQEDFELWISAFASLFQSAAHAHEKEKTVQDLFHQAKEKKIRGIKSWEEGMRPREKFLKGGAEVLSNSELLAMLIGSGTEDVTAVDLGDRILSSVGYDLKKLSILKQKQLAKFKGMGLARSSAILAAFELGRRAFGMKEFFKYSKGKKPLAVLR